MAVRLERFLNTTGFFFFALILFCLILLTPADAIYQCYETDRLTNIFFITGAYVITFLFAVLIYSTRIYTNRNTLTGIPKAWIPVEKEDVNRSVRRLVKEGLARSAVIAYQARPRDIAADEDNFQNHQELLIDSERPPWGHVEHPGWSSPASPDLPDLPYRTVIQELPSLIEAKAVSLAPADSLSPPQDPFGPSGDLTTHSLPDTRVVEVLQRPASMGLREYIRHLTSLGVIYPPELGAEFLALYEHARFSSRDLHEAEFRDLMHLFAEILRGMTTLAAPILDEIYDSASFRQAYSESIIGPSDEEGETDTVDNSAYARSSRLMRNNSLRPSNASTWETQSGYDTAPAMQSPHSGMSIESGSYMGQGRFRTPSTRSLRRAQSCQSGSSAGSVIRLSQPRDLTDLPYTIDYAGRRH
ncbi:hypothetical protein PENANT_c005G07620 [Penicillium antarcticum]|uniref:Defect at low temperature protein 1 n=1 Tax=Penicillium antarcticum TaxID=416450 RepID=A0A1V6QF80_9EURO|nr:uncharacterized protein N7508_007805 [Penicillium antarcticum]KAJ5297556.1 hypothetical protein N7508_007805 [Penicillium antarcticum]OQD87871.1 hypothetical protein PENANT_c005G07620 [Penicillium antarcticum]